ncbi:MAG: tRNA (adenosine(37)-N6)-threonylcarbamoyltransferase complex ATPase subunit type 1 TsaE [Planctomycetaceae bacterium]|nr:tRNA (adenosine(37)-N6)-threonylcarbamoyltransferase complex ATPase subunit type 1 TsaE [Planctomycetaceae bacterium]
MHWTCSTHSERETEILGQALATVLNPGMVVGLVGPLGAGKTQLVKAIAAGCGVSPDTVNSPTFVLIQEYPGTLRLYHFDAYRVGDLEEFLDLGVEELMAGTGVCLIEWANRFPEAMPANTLWIKIQLLSVNSREWSFRGTGTSSSAAIQQLQATWESAILHNEGDESHN